MASNASNKFTLNVHDKFSYTVLAHILTGNNPKTAAINHKLKYFDLLKLVPTVERSGGY